MRRPTVRVLLVEDDEDDVVLARDLLAEIATAAYEVDWQPDARAALRALMASTHDVALIDYRLGQEDGLSLISEAVAAGARQPLILLTGQGDHETDLEAMRAGASDYLVKGHITSTLLDRAIRYALERRRTLDRLRASEARHRAVVESAPDAIIVIDGTGAIHAWNRGAASAFGYTPEQALGLRVQDLVGAGSDQPHRVPAGTAEAWLAAVGPGTTPSGRRADGHEFPVEVSASSFDTPEGTLYTAIVRDVSERRDFENQLRDQALHDALTGLPNRVLFRGRVEWALTRLRHEQRTFAVLFLDLDHFKEINDTRGHTVGDELLVRVAQRLRGCLRASDTAARLGGDEFAVLLADASSPAEAEAVAERVVQVLRRPFGVGQATVATSASVGIVMASPQADVDSLLHDADVAMYAAKRAGRNRCAAAAPCAHAARPFAVFEDTPALRGA